MSRHSPKEIERIKRLAAKMTVQPKTWGTVAAEKNRAEMNRMSDSDRQRLLEKGMQLIYSAPKPEITAAHIRDWANRHDLKGIITDLRLAFEDARTFDPTDPTPE